jgi:hypothetical protein
MKVVPVAALLAFVAGFALGPMAESDLFFRIKAGQEILARRGLPGVNLYSFTYPDFPDLDASWLFEVAVAVIHGRAGFPGIVIAKTAVLVATFAAAYLLCRRRGAGPAASVVALAAAALVAHERFVERPHVFSFAGEVALLFATDALAAGRARVWVVLASVSAAVALWANLHAGVFVAPIVLAVAAVGAARDRNRAARPLAAAAVLAGLAMLATPLGWHLLDYLRLHVTLPAIHPVDEFRAPTLASDAALLAFALAGVALAAAARAFPGWTALAAPAVLGALACKSVRFGADFAIVSAPIVATALTRFGQRLPARVRGWGRAPLPAVAVTAFLLGVTVVPRVLARPPAAMAGGIGLDTRELPLSAIAFVDDNGLRERMYNDFEIGSYLLFDPVAGYPRNRVFVDPRLPAYPVELHRLLGRDDVTRAEWTAAMDRYRVDSALLAYADVNRRVAWWDPERWALVFRADDARVFVRRTARHQAIIAAREIPATFAFSLETGTATVPLETRPATSPVSDCEWQRRLGDLSFDLDRTPSRPSPRTLAAYTRALAAPAGCLAPAEEARLGVWLGALALGSGRAAEALELLDRALARGAARDAGTLANRAIALEALARGRDASSAWAEVEAAAAGSPLAARARERRRKLEAADVRAGAANAESPRTGR